jgi:uncharacterized protein (DUF1015 family)
MAILKAFKAIRPSRDKAHLVATRPVASYKKSVLKAKLETNPYSFIHIINPEFGEIVKTKANSKERFQNIKNQFDIFCTNEVLIQDQEDALYLYQQTKDGHQYLGIIGGASVAEYNDKKIKKHEATLTSREAMFTNYLDLVGFNAEPVLLAYPHHAELEKKYAEIKKNRPEYEFSTTDKVKHEVWILNQADTHFITETFKTIPATYIADGHHRSASSARLAELLDERGENSNSDNHHFFLAYFIDEERLNIVEYNRLIKKLNINENEFLEKLSTHFEITALDKPQHPTREHEITMNLKNKWYSLICKSEIIDYSDPVSGLDPEILTQRILTPILGIHDLRTNDNIDFISGDLGLEAISAPIKSGKADLGFVLFPLNMAQVKRVADNEMIMPPKSTWVEPKLRSGLTIYNIKE